MSMPRQGVEVPEPWDDTDQIAGPSRAEQAAAADPSSLRARGRRRFVLPVGSRGELGVAVVGDRPTDKFRCGPMGLVVTWLDEPDH
ncbi:hypothetical protein [Nakamurella sp. PAMC28650]|jgi:hypothetical protein|uniref:hypothetical protein n=1 Tax=Nakamurella sp. PAMC28650 TaxID=2762325 RepID=UPI00164E6A96|nr:hypothetical protein [Nakamurella sp. PAMC28650]QNK82694.1 hypothetical protein H7F38_08340 [Nakamurella sp. PAMC28650]